MGSLPGALLWGPTVLNLLVLTSILSLHWERYYYDGPKNTAQGEMLPFMLILLVSAPMAVAVVIGWIVVFMARLRKPKAWLEKHPRSVIALAIANILAPFMLIAALVMLA